MYKNCCKKCGSTELFIKKGNTSVGLYCSDCGAWVKWIGKDELRAFENSQTQQKINQLSVYKKHELNLNKVNNVEDCKKILKFLCELTLKPLEDGIEYNGFSDVEEYFN